MDTFNAYVAGLFDGEGSVSIARVSANGRSDYHKIVVTIGQRARHRDALDRVQAEFGGTVSVRTQKLRISQGWAEHASWQLQAKPAIERFLSTIQPYSIIKSEPIRIGLEFIRSFRPALLNQRNRLGQVTGMMLTADEIERREVLRLELREANYLGPTRARPSQLPPLDVQHRNREGEELTADASRISRGEARYNAALTEAKVQALRAEYATGQVTQEQLAERYGVSLMTISKAIHYKTWAHVT